MAKDQPFRSEATYTPISRRSCSRSQKSNPIQKDKVATVACLSSHRNAFRHHYGRHQVSLPILRTRGPLNLHGVYAPVTL
ncbi:hypothetical protein DB330_05540 [Lacticaseibacillus casei]|nr:hypothetical protein [Lacticaseibacillus casei]PTU96593.1 hypothetical protein DB330_05540 [Lacticaseibacillus casei]PTU98788.1 hypothetical protein DB326_05495 [Lacticaseibacillus casei]RXS57665.1 hypothetical protein ETB94_05415 [Lacticaseibacillus casei]TLF34832.1 hypothetical protein FEI10_05560 [Lacticaseibacillus casei]